MTFKEIQDLIKLINKTNLAEFKMKNGDFEISVKTEKFGSVKPPKVVQPTVSAVPSVVPISAPAPTPAPAPVTTPAATPENSENKSSEDKAPPVAEAKQESLVAIKSPIVGTFYRAPEPGKPPFVKVGDRVEVGQVVCIVEAMKLFNEIESEVAGTIVKVCVEDAQPVEYDQELFLVDTSK